MAFYDKFPYTNFQELNLDKIMHKIGDIDRAEEASAASAEAAKASEINAGNSEQAAADSAESASRSANASVASAEKSAYYLGEIGTHTAGAVSDWLAEHLSTPTTPPLDTSLTIANAAADSKAAGDAVKQVYSALDAISPNPALGWILNRNVDGSGHISSNNYTAVTDAIPVSTGDMVVRKTPNSIDNINMIGYISEFSGTTFLRRTAFNTYDQSYKITDPETTHIRIAFGRTAASGVEISQSDVDYYFRVEIFRKSITYADGFVDRGSISDQIGRAHV